MLVLDGHSTHYQPELIKYAREYEVILFCLPPHTTHKSQPLDASVFKPLKSHWHEACHTFVEQNPGKSITKYNFSKLLNTAWGKTMSPNIISSGFKRTGIYPFNPDAIDYGVAPDPVPEKDKQVTEVVSNEGKQTTVEEATMSSSEQQELSSYSREEEPPGNQFHQSLLLSKKHFLVSGLTKIMIFQTLFILNGSKSITPKHIQIIHRCRIIFHLHFQMICKC